jgi:hypothetical protein
MPTLLKFLKSLVKKLGFLKEGTLDVKPIFLIVKIRSMTAAKFSSVLKFLSCCYLLLLKISRIFLIRFAAARINLCPCSHFAVAKNLRYCCSYAVHQLCLAGGCEQGAVR